MSTIPKKPEDDEIEFIGDGAEPTPEPDFVNDEEIETARAAAEIQRIVAALYERHGDDEEAALADFKEYMRTRPDLAEACARLSFNLLAVEEGLIPRRDN